MTAGNEAGHVRHVNEKVGIHGVCDLPESLPVDDARIGGEAGDDHARPVFIREPLDLVIVDHVGELNLPV